MWHYSDGVAAYSIRCDKMDEERKYKRNRGIQHYTFISTVYLIYMIGPIIENNISSESPSKFNLCDNSSSSSSSSRNSNNNTKTSTISALTSSQLEEMSVRLYIFRVIPCARSSIPPSLYSRAASLIYQCAIKFPIVSPASAMYY